MLKIIYFGNGYFLSLYFFLVGDFSCRVLVFESKEKNASKKIIKDVQNTIINCFR